MQSKCRHFYQLETTFGKQARIAPRGIHHSGDLVDDGISVMEAAIADGPLESQAEDEMGEEQSSQDDDPNLMSLVPESQNMYVERNVPTDLAPAALSEQPPSPNHRAPPSRSADATSSSKKRPRHKPDVMGKFRDSLTAKLDFEQHKFEVEHGQWDRQFGLEQRRLALEEKASDRALRKDWMDFYRQLSADGWTTEKIEDHLGPMPPIGGTPSARRRAGATQSPGESP